MGDTPPGDVMTGEAVPNVALEAAEPGATEYVEGGGTVDCPGVIEDDGICAVKGAVVDAEIHLEFEVEFEFDVEADGEVEVDGDGDVGAVACVVSPASEDDTVSFTLPEGVDDDLLVDGDSLDAEEESEGDADSSTGVGNCIRCASAGVATRHHPKAKLRNIFAVFTKNPLSTGLVDPIFIPSSIGRQFSSKFLDSSSP
jgi:hypothetical protein